MSTATEPHRHVTAVRPRGPEVVVSAGSASAHPTVSLRSGLLAPRLLGTSPGAARVALVATTATLLGGDVLDLGIRVGAGQRLELEDVAATVAYDGRGRGARWSVDIAVESGATLVWHGEPLVIADGADVARSLHLDVARGGRVLMRDVVVLGRHGERGGSLRCRTSIWHDRVPLLIEDLDLAGGPGGPRDDPGVIGHHRVAETIVCLADPVPRPEAVEGEATTVMQLAGPGLLARRLAATTHRSPLDATWAHLSRAWAAEAGPGHGARWLTGP